MQERNEVREDGTTKGTSLKIVVVVTVALCFFISITSVVANGAGPQDPKIPRGARVFIAPMDGFETFLKAAIVKKKVAIEVVEDRNNAEYKITGVAESKKAGAAKKIIMGSWHSTENASIKVTDLKSGEVVYAYSVHEENSNHGQQSSAESCAKHLKDEALKVK